MIDTDRYTKKWEKMTLKKVWFVNLHDIASLVYSLAGLMAQRICSIW